MTLTGGIAAGSVSQIPIGATAIPADIPRRNTFGAFVGISYSFLGGGTEDAFKKPFAPPAAP